MTLYLVGWGAIGFTIVTLLAHLTVAYPPFRLGGIFLLGLTVVAIAILTFNRIGIQKAQLRDKFRGFDAVAANAPLFPFIFGLVAAIAIGFWTGIRP